MLVCLLLELAYFACKGLELILHPDEVLLDLWLDKLHEGQDFARLLGLTLRCQGWHLCFCLGG